MLKVPKTLVFRGFLGYNIGMANTVKTEETVTISKAEYESMQQRINWLMEQLKLSKKRQFGPSSEKNEYAQESLFNEAETLYELPDNDPELKEVSSYQRRKPRSAADRLPTDLPVEYIEHELPEEERVCPDCGGELHVMGRETRDELKLIPAKAVINRHVRHIYSCRSCEKNSEHATILKAETPNPVIKGSFASPEAIAHIATQKFVMGIPLYRQEQELERNGIHLSRQTMSNWLIRSTEDWLKPIYDRLRDLLLGREVLHADETTVKVLNEPDKDGKSKSHMWLYRTSGDAKHHIVLFDYKPSRSGEHAKKFLTDFKGYLHTDGYDEYHRRLPEEIMVVGCWAHSRRKFFEATSSLPKAAQADSEALRGLQYCDRLFTLERTYSGLPPDDNFDARRLARNKSSKPLMDEFFAWSASVVNTVLPKSLLGIAVNYACNQRIWLERVLLDGRLELSNNRAERSIKPFVIGRKNWLFNNTPRGADVSAMIYSIIETAKENNVNPFVYLSTVFHKSPNLPPGSSIDSLLPWVLCP